MRRIKFGAWLTVAALAVVGAGATIAGLTELAVLGTNVMVAGAALLLTGIVISVVGVIAYMEDRATTRKADFVLNQQRSAREAAQNEIDLKRFELELSELELRQEEQIRTRLDKLNQNVPATEVLKSGTSIASTQLTHEEREVKKIIESLRADGTIAETFTPQEILDTLVRVWNTTDKSAIDKRKQVLTANRVAQIGESVTAKNEMREQAEEEATSDSPAAYLAQQSDKRPVTETDEAAFNRAKVANLNVLLRANGFLADKEIHNEFAAGPRSVIAQLNSYLAQEEERTGVPTRPIGAVAEVALQLAEATERMRKEDSHE